MTARTEISSPTRNSSIDDGGARIAEGAIAQHRSHRAGRLRAGGADHGALAGGESRRLHHQRLGVAVDVRQRGGEILEGAARGRRDARRGHDVLGEGLRRLELRRRGARPEDRATLGSEAIRQPAGERDLGPDHGEVDAMHVGGVGQAVEVVGGDGEVGGELGGAGIARGAEEVGVRVFAAEGPAERVLPPAAADDQEPHDFWAFRNASRARSAARLAASATWLASSRASPA